MRLYIKFVFFFFYINSLDSQDWSIGINGVNSIFTGNYYAILDINGLLSASDQKIANSFIRSNFYPEIFIGFEKSFLMFKLNYNIQFIKPRMNINSGAFLFKDLKYINPIVSNIKIKSESLALQIYYVHKLSDYFNFNFGLGFGLKKGKSKDLQVSSIFRISKKFSEPININYHFYDLKISNIIILQTIFNLQYHYNKLVDFNLMLNYNTGLSNFYFLKGNYGYFSDTSPSTNKPYTTFLFDNGSELGLGIGIMVKL